jgi:hypothetical protein
MRSIAAASREADSRQLKAESWLLKADYGFPVEQ